MSSRGTVPLLAEEETEDTEEEEEDEPRLDSLDAADFLAAAVEVDLGGGRGWVRSLTEAREVGAVRGGGKAGEALCLTDSAGVKVCDRGHVLWGRGGRAVEVRAIGRVEEERGAVAAGRGDDGDGGGELGRH